MKHNFKYDVCIIGGCGHAGLPLALCFANEGKKVVALDIDQEKIDMIRKGRMPFKEEGGDELLREVLSGGNLTVTTDQKLVTQSENIILIIGTPLSSHFYPDTQIFFKTIEEYRPYFCEGQLLVLRSTITPGTTDKVKRVLEKNHFKIDLAFCPERIAEGNAIQEIYELPQIVAGYTSSAFNRAKELFSVLTDEIVALAPEEAELAKLFTNSWRYIRFAIANQFYMIANSRNIDFYRIYQAITYKYPRIQDMPKAGFAAGPCLFKDTMQLAAHAENNLFIGHAAMLINEGLPAYMVSALKKHHDLSKLKVGILGMAFKAESDDPRESLAYKLYNILEKECQQVMMTDPFVKDDRLRPLQEVVNQADLLIIGAPHKIYKELDLKAKRVTDIWNLFGKGGLIA